MITPQQATEQALRATINHAQTLRSLWLTADKVGCLVKDEKDSFITVNPTSRFAAYSYRKKFPLGLIRAIEDGDDDTPDNNSSSATLQLNSPRLGHHDTSMREAWDDSIQSPQQIGQDDDAQDYLSHHEVNVRRRREKGCCWI